MLLAWKEFKIHLQHFKKYLEDNSIPSDGIIATAANLNIIEAEPFTEQQILNIENHYNSLTQESEQEKFNFELTIPQALLAFKQDAIETDYPDNMTLTQTKAVLGTPLSDEELWTIYNWYTSQE